MEMKDALEDDKMLREPKTIDFISIYNKTFRINYW